MNRKRKEYQRVWIANKRTAIRIKTVRQKTDLNKFTLETSDNSDSEQEHAVLINSGKCMWVHDSIDADASAELMHEADDVWENVDSECLHGDVSSSSDSESEDVDIVSELRRWTADARVKGSQVNKLLPILKKANLKVPLSAKTLMQMQGEVQSRTLSGGDYLYLGVKNGLESVLSNVSMDELRKISEIHLAFNIDGLPLFSSSSYSLWPILCYAMNIKQHKVFVLALFGGNCKPSDLAFIQETVDELHCLVSTGIRIQDTTVPCILKMCVCDAKARQLSSSPDTLGMINVPSEENMLVV